MDKNHSNWKRMSFKGNKVWVATDESDEFILENDKVLLKYNLKQDYEYWVKPEQIKSDDPKNLIKKGAKKKNSPQNKEQSAVQGKESGTFSHDEPGVIHVFTDGASSGNPGSSGIGVLLRYGAHEKEISRHIGHGTNNIAELEAIRAGLLEIKKPDLPVRVYTDSSYALGLLSKGWKPTKNKELVEAIKQLMQNFKNIKLVKVKGHSGIKDNERADQLATSAITKREV